jgi:PAS domain S-box-containing protein
MAASNHLQLLFDHALDPMCVADRNGVLLLVNPAWTRVLGWPPERLLGCPMLELIHPDDQAASLAARARLHGGDPVVTFENRYRTSGGDWRWLSWNASVTTEGQVVGIARDITETKLLRRRVSSAEGSLDAMLAQAPMGLHLWEALDDGRLVLAAANPAADSFTGIATAQLLGKTIEEAFPDTLKHGLPARYRAVALGQAPPFRLDGIPYHDGRIDGFFDVWVFPVPERRAAAFFVEVTQRLVAERDLRITLDSIGDGVIASDAKGLVVRMNPVAQDLTGWSDLDAIGRPVDEIFRIVHADTGHRVQSPVERVLREGQVVGLANHTALVRRDGSRLQIADSGAPIRLPDGRISGVVLVFRDVTQEYALQRQLHHARKMDAIGQLAGGIAHDFNNLLGGIMGGADLLARQPLDARCLRWAEMITASASRAAELTQKLLAFGRKGQGQSVAFDVVATVHQVASILEHTIDRLIDLRVEVPTTPLWMLGDPSQVQSAVLNLCINARDSMPSGGQLRITMSQAELGALPPCRCSLGAVEPGTHVAISVTDTGCGISPDILDRIFEPFFTTKGPGKGSGLGLASVFATATAHAGAVTVDSETGHGSVFTLYLPLRPAHPEDVRPIVPVGTGERILVIDDEPAIRETILVALTNRGWTVDAAGDHLAAIAAVGRQRPDLVLLDLVMPGMSGIDLFTELRRIHPDLRILLMSGYNLHGARADGLLASGAAGFLQKPFRSDDLAAAVARSLAAG